MAYFNFQGKKIFYTVRGEGPLMIILPGNTAASAAHENELNYFSGRYRTAKKVLGSYAWFRLAGGYKR